MSSEQCRHSFEKWMMSGNSNNKYEQKDLERHHKRVDDYAFTQVDWQWSVWKPAYATALSDAKPLIAEWVAVDERLPENGQWVLYCGQSGSMQVVIYSHGRWHMNYESFITPTHWMALPVLPLQHQPKQETYEANV